MNDKIKWVLKQVIFFVVYLAIITLVDKIWGLFEGDSLLINAAAVTLGMIIFELCKVLFRKISDKRK